MAPLSVVFPLSNTVKSFEKHKSITWSTFKLATHSPFQYIKKNVDHSDVSGLTLFYRSILECYLCEKFGHQNFFKVKKLNFSHFESFEAFIKALDNEFQMKTSRETDEWEKKKLCENQQDQDLLHGFHQRYKNSQHQIAVWIALQTVICPIIEQLIVFDRLKYLEQNGAKSIALIPLFDPEISPRNLCIVASKEQLDLSSLID